MNARKRNRHTLSSCLETVRDWYETCLQNWEAFEREEKVDILKDFFKRPLRGKKLCYGYSCAL